MKTTISYIIFAGCLLGNSVAYAECQSNITSVKPNSIYIDHDDGTVTDKETGLMWQKCSLGMTYGSGDCTGTASELNWLATLAEAQAANSRGDYGHADWRLPNIKELASLTEVSCYYPAINKAIFPKTQHGGTGSGDRLGYWSSSPRAGTSYKPGELVWAVDFDFGDVGPTSKHIKSYGRLVRGGL